MKISKELFEDIWTKELENNVIWKLNKAIDVPFINEGIEEKAIRVALQYVKRELQNTIVE